MGKGSGRRPGEGYQEGWARIFGKPKEKQEQNQKFLELGGSRWLKRMMETASATGKRQSRVTELDTVGQMQNLWHLLTVALKDR